MSYQPGVPTGLIPLNQDYLNLQTNFTQINTAYNTDHVALTSSSGSPPYGFHTSVHLVPQAPPTNISGYGQVYNRTLNDGIATDQVLCFQSGTGNNNIQFTRNFLPVLSNNGYSYMAGPEGNGANQGALMMQWGKVSSTTSGTVTFSVSNKAFPNNCFSIWTQPFYTGMSAPNGNATVAIKQNTNVSFDWEFFTNSGAYAGFYWVALGN